MQRTRFGETPKYAEGLYDLGNRLYAWMVPNGSWGESNAGLIVGDGESLLVDTLWDLNYTQAMLDDVSELNDELGLTGPDSVGEELAGWYAELGYDLFSWLRPNGQAELTPFVRFESYDTQAEVPAGFASDPENDVDILTVGLDWKPTPGIVVKLDYMDVDDEAEGGT